MVNSRVPIMAVISPPQPVTVEAGTECGVDAVEVIVTNTLLIPHTTINITADFYETTAGGNVWLHICDTNDGEVPLTNNYVELWADNSTGPILIATLNETSSNFTGDNPVLDVLDVDETWCWDYQVTLWTDTTLIVNGYGTDPLGNPVAPPAYPSESQNITIQVGTATRTWGFWKTHLWLVEYMLGGSTALNTSDPYYTAVPIVSLPIYLGNWTAQQGVTINGTCSYMALMWAKQSHNSDGGKREKIDAARIHTAHQALAAIMNYYMPGGAPLPGGITLASIADTLTNGTIQEIRALGSALANYNESGDDEALDPSLPPTGKTNNADPQGARDIGAPCEAYWDTQEVIKVQGKGKGKGNNK
jgi:hypothetical protein